MGRRCWSLWLLLLILAHILFLVNQAGSSSTDKIIRLGYLMRRTRTAPAINVAIERAQNESILREYNYRYISLFVHMLRPSLYESPKAKQNIAAGDSLDIFSDWAEVKRVEYHKVLFDLRSHSVASESG